MLTATTPQHSLVGIYFDRYMDYFFQRAERKKEGLKEEREKEEEGGVNRTRECKGLVNDK